MNARQVAQMNQSRQQATALRRQAIPDLQRMIAESKKRCAQTKEN